jgi:hypothetical protein
MEEENHGIQPSYLKYNVTPNFYNFFFFQLLSLDSIFKSFIIDIQNKCIDVQFGYEMRKA